MKVFRSATTLLAIVILLFSACSKDDDSQNDASDFVGTYSVTETCDGASDNYSVFITAVGSDNEQIQILNLWDWAESVVANIDGNDITIESQTLDGITFTGSGTLSDDTLTIDYTAVDDTDSESCQAVCVKQ